MADEIFKIRSWRICGKSDEAKENKAQLKAIIKLSWEEHTVTLQLNMQRENKPLARLKSHMSLRGVGYASYLSKSVRFPGNQTTRLSVTLAR